MADDNLIKVDITAETIGLRDGLSRANAAMQQFAAEMKASFDKVATDTGEGAGQAKKSIFDFAEALTVLKGGLGEIVKIGAGVALGGVALGVGKGLLDIGRKLFDLSTLAAQTAEEFDNLSLMTGISVGNLSRLQFAAESTGGSLQSVVVLARTLGMRLAEIETSGVSKRLGSSLTLLGLSPEDLKDTYGTLLKVGDAIARTGGVSAQMRGALTDVFGRGATQMLPMIANFKALNEEAERWGLVLDSNALPAGRALDRELDLLNGQWRIFKVQIAELLAGPMGGIIQSFNDLAFAARGALHPVQSLIDHQQRLANLRSAAASLGIKLGAASASGLFGDPLAGVTEKQRKEIEAEADFWSRAGYKMPAAPGGGDTEAVANDAINAQLLAKFAATERLKLAIAGDTAEARIESARRTFEFLSQFNEAEASDDAATAEKKKATIDVAQAQLISLRTAYAKQGNERQIASASSLALAELGIERDKLAQKFQLGQIGANDRIDAQIAFANQEFEIEEKAINQRLEAARNEPAKYAAILDQRKALRLKHEKEIQAIIGQSEVDQQALQAATLSGDQRLAVARISLVQSRIAIALGLNQIGSAEALAAEIAAENTLYAIRLDALNRELKNIAAGTAAHKQKVADIEEAEIAHQKRMIDLNAEGARLSAAVWERGFDSIADAFETSTKGIIQGTQTIGAGFRNMFQSIALEFISSGVKDILKGNKEGVLGTGIFIGGVKGLLKPVAASIGEELKGVFAPIQAQFGTLLTGMLRSAMSWVRSLIGVFGGILPSFSAIVQGISSLWSAITSIASAGMAALRAIGLAMTLSKAKEAAAAMFSWVIQGVPFPFNLVVAPVAAAAAFAGTMAFGAERGALIPSEGLFAQLHPKELVLPATISTRLIDFINGGQPAAAPVSVNYTVHFRGNAGKDFQQQVRRHAREIGDIVAAQIRDNRREGRRA